MAGLVLKSQTGWYSNGNGRDGYEFSVLPAGNGTDAFGFSALPAGFGYSGGSNFLYFGNRACFWSSTAVSRFIACFTDLYNNLDLAYLNHDNTGTGFSVRCLRD